METIIIQADKEKASALKHFLDAFQVDYEIEDDDESPYNPEFVKEILERSKSARKGDTIKMDPKDPWGSLGLK